MGRDYDVVNRVSKLELEMQDIQSGNRIFKDELREEVREVRKQNESIHEIATSVKLMAQDIQVLRTDMQEVKAEQKEFGKTINQEIGSVKKDQSEIRSVITGVDNKEAKKALKSIDGIKEKLIWLVVGGIAAYLLYYVFPFLK